MIENSFINLKLKNTNLDHFHIRDSIFYFLSQNISLLTGKLVDIGCGKMPYRDYILNNSVITSYIGLDIEGSLSYDAHIKPDFTWDGQSMPFESNSFDCAIATEVLEHCPVPEVTLAETFRVLKPGAYFFFTVPFLWNLHEIPHDEYRYTPFALERLLKEAGFSEIKITPHGGWHASLAQMIGLWVRRAPMSKRNRRILSIMLQPIISYLLKKDKAIQWSFTKPIMITGMAGMAKK